MNARFRLLFAVSTFLSLAGCDKPTPQAASAPGMPETDNQLAEARDALQRQAMEIETKTALMDKQLAEMAQSLKDRENTELRDSLETLKRQNEALRVQADAARQQSDAITQRIAVTPQPNVAAQPVVQADYSLFYEQLAPFGRWFDVNGYGYCWRPTITVAGWRPYVDGCWVWSSLGWAWQSNEAFGWATYHYGRWVNLSRYGWVWVPGSEWAPAWVAWRQSRDCVGWAPLPPEPGVCNGVYRDCDSRYGLGPTSYTFINTNQFVNSSYISVYAPVTQQTTIFQHSVNVTQIVPRSGHGHAFVNQGGPPRAQMEQACRQPVPQRHVQTMHADQMSAQQHHQHGGHREQPASAVAMVELPALTPGTHRKHPDVKEHIQRPALVSGFEGVPQRVATEIRETIAKEKETAAVQQQPVHGRTPHGSPRHPGGAPAVVNVPPVLNAPSQETVRPAASVENPGAPTAAPTLGVAVERTHPGPSPEGTSPNRGMPQEHKGERHRQPGGVVTAPAEPAVMPAVIENKAGEPSGVAAATPAVEPGSTAPAVVASPPATMPQTSAEQVPADAVAEKARVHAAEGQAQGGSMQHRQRREGEDRAGMEKRAAEQAMAAEGEKARQQAEATAQQQRMTAEQAAAEAEKTRRQAEATAQQRMAAEQAVSETEKARQHAEATAQQQRMAAEQAVAETERTRQQAEVAAQQKRMAAEQAAAETEKVRQQAEATAQQQRMAAEQATAEAEKTRQQTEATAQQQRMAAEQAAAMQKQQELAAQEQRAAAERMASDQAAAEAARAAQQAQAEAAAMQRQQEEARRAAEEQQMRAQQEAAQRAAQEMAQRQAEEQARRQQEAEMQRAQEQARQEQMRAQQEAAQRAQEMAQRQAEEQARRQQEAEMQRAQEQARQEQMRAQQEAAQRAAQEMAQRQAEEAQRAAAEAAQRAAAEAARNQPQPAPGS